MAQCVILNSDGTFTATTDAPNACQGYLLQTSTEYASSQVYASFLAMPTQDQVTQAFNLGVVWPVFFYLVAYQTGLLANFFNRK
jgi:hypothetical protein